ncbi:phage protease [Candidatus Vondammii sp. HM_W22]|uniref:phage protease n=1 Tax=Candidatus Vondammii sp. HM_W22 TaxID=2687299 RepID=UPI001F146495|nr:phage protease [Candidatus Vondammii sp. HM_W22]
MIRKAQENPAIAARVIARAAARRNDLVIDYEHQTLKAADNGQLAPAAGWVKLGSLERHEGKGIFARLPDWINKAAAHIDTKEYRFISPVFSYSPKTGEVLDILHVALTNTPAIDGMNEVDALAAAKFELSYQPESEESTMDELLKLFGLGPDATESEAIAAAKAATLDTAVTAMRGNAARAGCAQSPGQW